MDDPKPFADDSEFTWFDPPGLEGKADRAADRALAPSSPGFAQQAAAAGPDGAALGRRAPRRRISAAGLSSLVRSIVEAAPEAILTCDAEARILWTNPASASIFGRSQDELVGAPLSTVLPDLGRRPLDEWIRDAGIAGRVIAHDTSGQRVDGTRFPCAVSCSALVRGQESGYSFMVRDTTDTKWAEQELLLRDRALEAAGDGIVISSMTLPGEPIIYANAAFHEISGYTYEEVIGRNCRFLQGDDRDQEAIAQMRAAVRERRGCRVLLRNYRKDGTMFWNQLTLSPVLGADGIVTHYVGVQSDVTGHVAQEETLQRRTERLNSVFDLSPDGFVSIDDNGVVQIVNPAFERMTGLRASDLIDRPCEVLDEQLGAIVRSVESLDADPAGPEEASAEAQGVVSPRSDGAAQGKLLHIANPLPRTLLRRVRRGEARGETVMVFRDMTRELEVDRMKSEFLSMAAHELRTPMASIFGFTELLLKRRFDDKRREDMLSTIHRQAGVLINLVNELLDLARIESRRGKDFHRAVRALRPIIESTVAGILVNNDPRSVQMSLPQDTLWVDVDAEKLSLAITNVVSNAYKYSPQGGAIELEVVRREHKGGPQAGVRVRDHGIGMTPEQQARLFERFFRADTSGNIPGTGLGMTIMKEIVELHGGTVEVQSTFGAGTTVTMWLPIADPAARATPADAERVA